MKTYGKCHCGEISRPGRDRAQTKDQANESAPQRRAHRPAHRRHADYGNSTGRHHVIPSQEVPRAWESVEAPSAWDIGRKSDARSAAALPLDNMPWCHWSGQMAPAGDMSTMGDPIEVDAATAPSAQGMRNGPLDAIFAPRSVAVIGATPLFEFTQLDVRQYAAAFAQFASGRGKLRASPATWAPTG